MDLLYSIGNYTQYLAITWENNLKNYIYIIYIYTHRHTNNWTTLLYTWNTLYINYTFFGCTRPIVAHRLSCPKACGILVPIPGTEPTSPALKGRFLTTGPLGKSQLYFSKKIFLTTSFWEKIKKKRWVVTLLCASIFYFVFTFFLLII